MKKLLKSLLTGLLLAGILFSLTGCANKTTDQGGQAQQQAAVNEQQPVSETGQASVPTKENPIVVNKEEGVLLMAAEVNGKYLYEPTRHAAVFKGGSNGEKAVFRGLADVQPFHDALVEIGAKAGENMTLENKETTAVQGDILDITVTWEGAEKEYTLDEVIKDSNGKPIIMHFGGNLTNALDKKTGCLLCLDSCPVGIVSNESYTYGAVEKRNEVTFIGNKDLLPSDGTVVTIKIKVKK